GAGAVQVQANDCGTAAQPELPPASRAAEEARAARGPGDRRSGLNRSALSTSFRHANGCGRLARERERALPRPTAQRPGQGALPPVLLFVAIRSFHFSAFF